MKRIVIIGGGFAGFKIAKALQNKFNVTLVDSKNYFEYTPSILKSIINPNSFENISLKYEKHLKNTKYINGTVQAITKEKIILNDKKILSFDYLIISTGSSYSLPIKNQNTIIPNRAKELINNYKKLCKAKNILIIGGGIVGTELAAEIVGKYKNKKITLVHSGKRLMPRNNPKTSKYAEKYLTEKGIKIILNEKVIENKNETFKTNKNNKIKTDISFLTTGIKANSNFMYLIHATNQNAQIEVNKHLQLKNYQNIFAPGDVNNIKEEKTAQSAEKQAKIVINNILALEEEKELKEYIPQKKPTIISLGKWNGILEYKNFTLTGIIPAILKKLVELKTILKYRF
jgi:apoptosis-inducing factor 2